MTQAQTNSAVAARTQKPSTFKRAKSAADVFDNEPVAQERLQRQVRDGTVSLADQLSKEPFHRRNWMIPNGAELFPFEPSFRSVSRYYERSPWGPLLIDEPILPPDLKQCQLKAEVLRPLGLTYLYLTQSATLEDAIQQIEECQAIAKKKGDSV